SALNVYVQVFLAIAREVGFDAAGSHIQLQLRNGKIAQAQAAFTGAHVNAQSQGDLASEAKVPGVTGVASKDVRPRIIVVHVELADAVGNVVAHIGWPVAFAAIERGIQQMGGIAGNVQAARSHFNLAPDALSALRIQSVDVMPHGDAETMPVSLVAATPQND